MTSVRYVDFASPDKVKEKSTGVRYNSQLLSEAD